MLKIKIYQYLKLFVLFVIPTEHTDYHYSTEEWTPVGFFI